MAFPANVEVDDVTGEITKELEDPDLLQNRPPFQRALVISGIHPSIDPYPFHPVLSYLILSYPALTYRSRILLLTCRSAHRPATCSRLLNVCQLASRPVDYSAPPALPCLPACTCHVTIYYVMLRSRGNSVAFVPVRDCRTLTHYAMLCYAMLPYVIPSSSSTY